MMGVICQKRRTLCAIPGNITKIEPSTFLGVGMTNSI
jgi:hypothetical protein